MREKILGIMIPLGHDKHVLSDTIIAVEPLPRSVFFGTDQHGNKLRSRVLINHAEGEILASRTAEMILKSMTKQNGKVLEDGREVWKLNKGECQLIVDALVHYSTVRDAIESLPFGETKYYQLVKQYGIDVKAYLESTDDPDMFKDQQDDALA